MPYGNGDDDSPLYDVPVEEQQEFLYVTLGFADEPQDQYAHDMFWAFAYDDSLDYAQRMEIYQEFAEYIYDEYGIEFELVWDWEDFREWYDAQ